MRDLKGKISIVMPAYNEADHILNSLLETVRTFNEFGCSWELIVLDDGSTDNTEAVVQQFLRNYSRPGQIIFKKNASNLGKGRAIKKALHFISGDYVVFLDADMDLHPQQIETFFDIMRLDNCDIVIGSKLHPNSVVNYPLDRRVMSFIYYCLVRVLFSLPCHDTQTGLKLFKVEAVRAVFPRILVKKFAYDLEVLVNAHHLGYRIAEAPVVLKPQRHFGRIGPKAIFATFWDTLAIFYRMRILKYYDRISYYRRKNLGQEFRRMRE